MIFTEIFTPASVVLDELSVSKTAALQKLSHVMVQQQPQLDEQALFSAYWQRENLGSTAIGHGISIPHVRIKSLDHLCGAIIKLHHPVDFGAEDKQPCDLLIGLAVPEHQTDTHLRVLARLVESFSKVDFREACREAKTQADLYQIVSQEFSQTDVTHD